MCDGTLRSDIDGHTEARWFALKPEGLALQNPLARMQSPDSNRVTLMVLNLKNITNIVLHKVSMTYLKKILRLWKYFIFYLTNLPHIYCILNLIVIEFKAHLTMATDIRMLYSPILFSTDNIQVKYIQN